MIDFSTLKELYVDGKKVTSLFLDGHEVPFGEEPSKYFTVTALEQDATVSVNKVGSPPDFSLEYSTDGNMWSSYSAEQTVTLAASKSVMFRRVGDATTTFSSDTSNYWKFSFSANAKVSGNIMSLLDASMQSTTVGASAFCRLFFRNNRLVDISELELPATTLADWCYREMFAYCTSLSAVPTLLPATTLASNCYTNMFNQCRSLTNAPALPATTLASGCYAAMFGNCSSLTAAPELPATTLASICYQQMFYRCSSLAAAPALPAMTLAQNCYVGMFQECTSLSTAPALPATTLASGCYQNMFRGCTSLASAPELPATTLESICYHRMFNGCSSLSSMDVKFTAWSPSSVTDNWLSGVAATGTFICPSALGTDATIQRGENYCPNGWTVVNSDAA